jgi:hypothetical protein
LNDAHTWLHTNKQIVEHVVASHTINIVPITNYRYVKPQNHPTLHEHATQGFHIVLGGGIICSHPFFHTYKRELPSKCMYSKVA